MTLMVADPVGGKPAGEPACDTAELLAQLDDVTERLARCTEKLEEWENDDSGS